MILDNVINMVRKSKELNRERMEKSMRGAVWVKADNVSRYIFQELDKEHFDIHNDFPNVTAPWDDYFVSFKHPSWTYSKQYGVMDTGVPVGQVDVVAFVHTEKISDVNLLNIRQSLSISIFMINPDRYIATGAIPVDNDGKVVSFHGPRKAIPVFPSSDLPEHIQEFAADGFRNYAQVVLMTNCFCHCKNIDHIETKVDDKLIRRRVREGKIPINKFYTLNINSNHHHSTGVSVGHGSGKSFHICRGHFKHFTADNPLLGKHVGTYWWSMHAKGDKLQGKVTKDYNINTGDANVRT